MSSRNLSPGLIRIYVFMLAVLLAWLIGLASIPISSIDQRLFNDEAIVPQNSCMGQTFYSDRAGLTRIDISLVARGQAAGTVTMQIREGSYLGPVVHTVTRWLTAPDVESPTQRRDPYEAFSFPPLSESAGKTYAFCVEVSNPDEEPFLLRFHKADVYPDGTRYEGGRAIQGDLAFRVYHVRGIAERLQELGKRLAYGKPGVLGQPAIYALLFGIHMLALLALLARMARCSA